ncbi:MAG: FadR/GntR family transcriptional regulator [Pseudomonadota bacterium]
MDSPTDTTTNGPTGGKADQVARTITDLIAGGSLSPGERLPGERQLAERMGVSRVSVRAALQRLKAQGMVTSVQGGGTRVASASANLDAGLAVLLRGKLDNLHDLAEIRMALETWAAGRAAERATDIQIAEIKGHLDAMEAAGPRRGADSNVAREDALFHMAIGKASQSPVYTHILATIRSVLVDMLDFHRYELFSEPNDDAIVLEQHRAVFEAIERRDAAGAQTAMQDHLRWVLAYYARHREPESSG